MVVFDRDGSYLPSKLAADLQAAGIDCLGVTCTQAGDPPEVVGVQIVCADGTDGSAVDTVLAAYTPPTVSDVATSSDADSASAVIVSENLATAGMTRDALAPTFASLLAQAKSAIPYYETYTLQPDPATAWASFQILDQATKDRILYNCCRSLAALMRYLSGDLPPA